MWWKALSSIGSGVHQLVPFCRLTLLETNNYHKQPVQNEMLYAANIATEAPRLCPVTCNLNQGCLERQSNRFDTSTWNKCRSSLLNWDLSTGSHCIACRVVARPKGCRMIGVKLIAVRKKIWSFGCQIVVQLYLGNLGTSHPGLSGNISTHFVSLGMHV